MDGILLVDKPSGITSHDVIDELRSLFGQRRIGHSGTLDPLATGLLVVMVGRATRLSQWLQADEKEYEGLIKFGVATDSLDADGRVVATRPCIVTDADLSAAAKSMVGRITQIPPMVSAIKVSGRKLYTLARLGVDVDRRPRHVTIHALELELEEPGEFPVARFKVRCSKGTYVRSLVADLATRVGCVAHLAALRRTAVGRFNIKDARTLDELRRLADEERLERAVLPMASSLLEMPGLRLDDAAAKAAGTGQPVPMSEGRKFNVGEIVRLLDAEGGLIGVARVIESAGQRLARPVAVFR